MPVSVADIDRWRQQPSETEALEFKEAKQQIDFGNLLEYCVAIGNEGDGHLILGVRNAPPRNVVGTGAIDNPVGMAEKLYGKLGFRVRIDVVTHPDGRVVVLTIPGRPRGHAYNLDGRYLMRVGQSIQPMSADQLRSILVDTPQEWIEGIAASRVSGSEVLELLDVDVYFRRIGIPRPSGPAKVMERLVQAQLIDHVGDRRYAVRRIAALVFAKRLADFPDLARKAPRLVVYAGLTKVADPAENRIGGKGYAVGFEELMRFAMRQIPEREIIRDGVRRAEKMVPEIAVRELLANALVHQDISIRGTSVMVDIFSNRVEISNPGTPILPLDRLIDGVRSRNERLADLLRNMGICEERGSGIDKVVHAVEVLHLPAPDFRQVEDRTLIALYGPRSFDDMDRSDRVRACYQHCALKFECSERMTNQSLRERFKLPPNKTHLVSQVISASLEDGVIKPDEKAGTSKKFARYVPHWVQ
jgi:ATP-dependent DNA helicase RecG